MKERFIKPDEPVTKRKMYLDELSDMTDKHFDCRQTAPPSLEEMSMYALVEIAKSLRGIAYIIDSRLEDLT